MNLGCAGAPACSILCSGDQLQMVTNVLGSGAWSMPVPPLPGTVFFNQVFALDLGANGLGMAVSNGGRGAIWM